MFKLPVLLDLIGFHVPFARVACVSLFSKVANTSKPVVEHSSSTIQRSRWYCTNCSGPWVLAWLAFCVLMRMLANECKVIPAIKAAWVCWGARCTNSCGCVHSQMVSKNCRSHFKVCVFPAPGTPWKMVLHGSLRHGVSASSCLSPRQRWITALTHTPILFAIHSIPAGSEHAIEASQYNILGYTYFPTRSSTPFAGEKWFRFRSGSASRSTWYSYATSSRWGHWHPARQIGKPKDL